MMRRGGGANRAGSTGLASAGSGWCSGQTPPQAANSM
jgi:hypothetical protein